MKKIILSAGLLAISLWGISACTVDAGIGGGPGGGTCEDVSCSQALSTGLQVQGDALCNANSDAVYTDLWNCACNGACPECGGSLCTDSPMDGACADCIGANCASASAACDAN